MKHTHALVIAAALAVAGSPAFQQAQAKAAAPASVTDRPAIEKAIAANETKINEAYVKADIATMKSMIADTGVAVDMNGSMLIADMYKMLGTVKMSVTTQALSNMKFVWADDNTVVLTYTWTGKGTANGQPIPSPMYASSVWTKRGTKWTAIFHQETAAAPAPPKK